MLWIKRKRDITILEWKKQEQFRTAMNEDIAIYKYILYDIEDLFIL